jgi:hypothetical protein
MKVKKTATGDGRSNSFPTIAQAQNFHTMTNYWNMGFPSRDSLTVFGQSSKTSTVFQPC